jgi:DNA polymerase-3 subunit delta'
MLNEFPWQNSQWQQIQQTRLNDRLPHALLLEGPEGIGLKQFSLSLSVSLLCENSGPAARACGDCKSCHLFNAGSHPDLKFIEPEEDGKQIKVDQIRKIIEFMNLKSVYGAYKIVILRPAESMNRNAANTLLKTLEEPPGKSLLLLLSHRPNLLPITIRSRCQHIRFKPSFDDITVQWLKDKISDPEQAENLLVNAGGAPLAAVKLLENNETETQQTILEDLVLLGSDQCDPLGVAKKWNNKGVIQILRWLILLIRDMARLKVAAQPVRIKGVDAIADLQHLINGIDLSELAKCHDLVLKNYSMASGPISYNTQGLIEDFIIYWQQINEGGN